MKIGKSLLSVVLIFGSIFSFVAPVQASVLTNFVIGGDRPVKVYLPLKLTKPAPILISLHGYTSSGAQQEAYVKMRLEASKRGVIYLLPDGTADASGNRFWNAGNSCCNFFSSAVDDEKYLMGLIDKVAKKYPVDRKRIYIIGHSNGGFMAYKLACDQSASIAAVVSFAGSLQVDRSTCPAKHPISILHIHGTNDTTILPAGGDLVPGHTSPYASVQSNLTFWAKVDGCKPTAGLPKVSGKIDLESSIAGAETSIYKFSCPMHFTLQYWSIAGGEHVPQLSPTFAARILDFLLAQSKV
jgi:polyhydroxybutyrate depolymerase